MWNLYDHIVTQLLNNINLDNNESDCNETFSDNEDFDFNDCANNENH